MDTGEEDASKIFVIRWWGPAKPILHGLDTQVEVPVGATCYHCRERISEGEQGWSLPRYRDQGFGFEPYHYTCLMENLHLI